MRPGQSSRRDPVAAKVTTVWSGERPPLESAGPAIAAEVPQPVRDYVETLDAKPDAPALYFADEGGAIVWSNPAFRDLSQLQDAADGAATRAGATVPEILQSIDRSRLPLTREDMLATTQGVLSYRSSHTPVLGPDGTMQGSVGHFENVSELWETKRQLRAAHDRLDDVMRLSSEWLWEVGPDLRLMFLSPRVTELLGVPPEALIGRRLLDLGFFQTEAGEDPVPLDVTKRVPFRNRAFSMPHTDGQLRHFWMSSLPVFHSEDGSFRGFRGTARDVTREREAELAIETSRTRLRQAIESITEGFALFDSEDRLVLCNETFLGFFASASEVIRPGIRFEDIMIAARHDVITPEGPELWREKRMAVRNSFSGSIELKLADGRWIRASDRRTEDGGSVGIRTDITELKRREEALSQAKELAESANRAKTEFLANISHELRTPLNAIIGFSEIVRDELFGPIGNSKYREYLSDVLHSAKHLLSVINDILDLSKAEAGKLDLIEETVSLSVLVESAIRLVRDRADRANVSMRAVLDRELPLIYADRRKMLQVLLNLLTNSIKFTPAGGTIEINAGVDIDGDLELSVTDTGIGMAPEHLETALAPFGQVDSALSRRFEGTGLGLPLTSSMVALHQGSLTIESQLGEGTKITVRLPAHRSR